VAYCTVDDIKSRIGEAELVQLTDDEATGTVSDSRIEEAIEDADREIDGHVGLGLAVPLSPVPPVIRKLSADIALYNLFSRRSAVPVPDSRIERYKSAVAFLERVAAGKVSLGMGDPEGSPRDPESPRFSEENPERAFTRSSMKEF
jgi:phage gp36-like protein